MRIRTINKLQIRIGKKIIKPVVNIFEILEGEKKKNTEKIIIV